MVCHQQRNQVNTLNQISAVSANLIIYNLSPKKIDPRILYLSEATVNSKGYHLVSQANHQSATASRIPLLMVAEFPRPHY